MDDKITLTGHRTTEYVLTAPRELLFDGDGPAFNSYCAKTLGEVREKASHLNHKDAKIYLHEYVEVDGFSGLLHRSTEQSLTA